MWPPPYKIRISQKAKYIRLLITHKAEVEIVLPKNCQQEHGLEFLNQKRNWVENHLNNLPKSNVSLQLPQSLDLHALQRSWQVLYEVMNQQNKIKMIMRPDAIVLLGATQNYNMCIDKLTNWVRKQAKIHLTTRLQYLSDNCQLPFNKLSIRGQITRWGSCNTNKDINLNYKLLFLPKELVDYVLIHELCHTIHFNHSQRFWRLVKKHVPDYLNMRDKLREANQYLPIWQL